MKKNIKNISVAILLLIICVFFIRVYIEWDNFNISLFQTEHKLKQKELEIDFSNDYIKMITKYSGLKTSLMEYLDVKGNTQLLSEFASNKGPILVFRNSELMCSACVNEELKNLNQFNLLSEPDKCCIITNYSNQRNLNYFTVHNKINIDVLNIKLLIELDNEIDGPYYFVLQKDLTVSHLYLPDILSNSSLTTKEYLNFVTDKYFSKTD